MFHTPEADAILSTLDVFPPDNPWNQVVADWPLHPNSAKTITSIGVDKPLRYNADTAFILVAPATHFASRHENKDYPSMGERIRLCRDFDVSGFSPEVRTILNGLKQYGMFLADNGIEWAISVSPDPRIGVLHEELRRVGGFAFEVVAAPEWRVEGPNTWLCRRAHRRILHRPAYLSRHGIRP